MNSKTSHRGTLPCQTFIDRLLPGVNAPKSARSVTPLCQKHLLKTLALLVVLISSHGCGRPPQVVDDEECFSAVEGLWTAVTTKRSDLLEQSATELDRLHTAGKLSEEGHDVLDEIIQSARDEAWQPAAQSLKAFMLGQRKTQK